MKNIYRKIILYILYLCFASIPLYLFINTVIFPLTVYQIGQLLGISALTLLCLQPLLTSRLKFLDKIFGFDNLTHLHTFNAKLALVVLLFHPLMINIFYFKSVPSAGDLLSLYTIYHYLGVFLLLSIIFTVLFSIFHTKFNIKYEVWNIFHKFNWVIIPLLFLHVYNLGSNFIKTDPLFYWGILLASIVLISFVYRFIYIPYFGKSIYVVKDVIKETPNAFTIKMYHKKGPKILNKPGQFSFVKFISNAVSKEEHHFTISSWPSDEYLSFTIKQSGDYTQNIKNIKKGDIAHLEGPLGSFTNMDLKGNFLFIAGGIGITPIISMLRYLSNNPQKTYLLYSCKEKSDIAYRDEIEKLSKDSWFKARIYLTKEDLVNGYKMGRIDEYAISEALKFVKNPYVFLVGPDTMMDDISKKLIKAGISKTNIFTEKFSLK